MPTRRQTIGAGGGAVALGIGSLWWFTSTGGSDPPDSEPEHTSSTTVAPGDVELDVTIDPDEIRTGNWTTVYITATNVGDETVSYEHAVWIRDPNGEQYGEQKILSDSIEGGGSNEYEYKFQIHHAGSFDVVLDGAVVGTVTVVKRKKTDDEEDEETDDEDDDDEEETLDPDVDVGGEGQFDADEESAE